MKLYLSLLSIFLLAPIFACADSLTTPAPIASVTTSAEYVFSYKQYKYNRNLVGWSVVPEINVVKHVGLQADFVSLYMFNVYPGQTRFIAAAGPRINLAPHSRFGPFVFGEGGEMRISSQRSLLKDWNPVAKGGIGMDFRVSPGLALTLVPLEYLGQYRDDGTWNHSATARVGITFNMIGNRSRIF